MNDGTEPATNNCMLQEPTEKSGCDWVFLRDPGPKVGLGEYVIESSQSTAFTQGFFFPDGSQICSFPNYPGFLLTETEWEVLVSGLTKGDFFFF